MRSLLGIAPPLIIAAALLAAACGGTVDAGPAAPAVAELRVTRGDLRPRVLLTGELEAVDAIELRVPQTSERRVQLQTLVADGAEVEAGDVLAEFDNTSFATTLEERRTAVRRAESALAEARAEAAATLEEADRAVERARIALAKARLDAGVPESVRARVEHARYQLALTRAVAAHESAIDDRGAAAARGESEVRIRSEELARARRKLAEAEGGIDALRLVAPRAGIAVLAENPQEGRPLQPGDTLWVGLPVVSLPDLSRMRVTAMLSDVDDGLIEVGAAVRCVLDIYPELELSGHVTSVAAFARELRVFSLRRGLEVSVELERTPSSPPLVPGMSVRVEAERPAVHDVLLVPRAALSLEGGMARASTPRGWVEVEVGPCDSHACVLEAGLDEGDRLLPALGVDS